nr:RNA-directed DNA polymerase, eukaryota [Tanacetum cinerariifolium]
MSKLDRFLVTDGFLSLFPYISAVCLDRHLSDHRPILLREMRVDFGATPFRLYHSWFSIPGFDQMITSTWNSFTLVDSNGMIIFKKKLQLLRKELNSSDNCDFVQKAKVRWALEGDENSKFFHGIINRKRANLFVKGIMSEGEWVDDLICVKDEFRNHFADRFNDPGTRHGRISFSFPNRLTIEQVFDLEASVSEEEIHKAVWGCVENKSLGKASVLVNGSPTSEFQFHRGLKQGDPLAPFLFILIMESLHLSFNRVVEAGIFTGLRIDDALTISHLFYADDAIFIGKCHILGLGIRGSTVSEAAASLGCSVMKTLFNYLGIMVGGNVYLVKSWDETVHKLMKRLSKWKLKTLSICGHLTLLKSVLGSTLIYNMSIFKVPMTVLNKMENLRRNFFNGIQEGDRKITWVKGHSPNTFGTELCTEMYISHRKI